MVTISFPSWSDALAEFDLSDKVRDQHRIIINWYLGYLKGKNLTATVLTARDFVDHLIEIR